MFCTSVQHYEICHEMFQVKNISEQISLRHFVAIRSIESSRHIKDGKDRASTSNRYSFAVQLADLSYVVFTGSLLYYRFHRSTDSVLSMWRVQVATKLTQKEKLKQPEEDDWDTNPDFVNDVSEKESRWGAKSVEGSGHQESVSLDLLRKEVIENDNLIRKVYLYISISIAGQKLAEMPKASEGYGGKFGVQKDRMDKCAKTWEYAGKVDKHASQKDYAKGFGGRYGVELDRKDKSALGWDEKMTMRKVLVGNMELRSIKDKSALGWDEQEKLPHHESQTDYKKGFGGKFGIQEDRKDKSAHGWEEHEKLQQHESQIDYKRGFGGKFGVQEDRKDKSALGWDEHEKLATHQSQIDYKRGFGGKFGILEERTDKSAFEWDEHEKLHQHASQTEEQTPLCNTSNVAPKGRALSLRAKFEQFSFAENNEKVQQERERRKREDEELCKQQQKEEKERQKK
ncbi:Src substrate cortactin [Dirofilaria immitis]|nr:Src substrate cortactin [Dirofilaria immitis]